MTAAPVTAPVPTAWPRRVVVGAVLGFGSIALVFWPPGTALLVLLLALACLREFAHLGERKGTALNQPVAAAAIVAYVVLTYVHLIRPYESALLATTVIAALALALFTGTGGYVARCAYTLFGVLYIGKLPTYFIALRALPTIGIAATVTAIVAIAMTDIFAMLVGVRWGRTPLTPISPRKTVEGAVGGFVAAVVVGVVAAATPWLRLPWYDGAVIGAITSLGAQCGDLVESALKRDARVKDAGTMILGHGGALDRFDSYLFGGIAFYFALWLLGAIPHGFRGA